MPSPEQPQTSEPQIPQQPEGQVPTADAANGPEQAEQHFKTVAVRVHEDVHAQLSFIAQLSGSNLSEQIRRAIGDRITAAQSDPELIARAEAASKQIEREAAARTAAIAGFIGKPATAAAAGRQPRTAKTTRQRN
ncbi:hypothetical protein [Nocardioides flavescens]|uniref:Uncharacterized protein n=1 Tax=Nocardioides flavescens TaxID=2691959 RepID=A0A6L7ESC3_9ACTN|nr:hypothetical protein [Nocardioides flavescens]MXG88438.1 hypothetical protein [Nocardioides flavescens]